jgi:hypothetical protein
MPSGGQAFRKQSGKAMSPSPTAVPAAKTVSLLTQEIRFAVTLTGGISLAVWMGGVCRELDVLTHASDDRAAGRTSSHDPVQEGYRRLLDILDVTACVDVISGTSAGGINAALLGLVNAQRKDLAPLRDVWLKAGSLATLLRDTTEAAPPSLLRRWAAALPATDRHPRDPGRCARRRKPPHH